MKQCKIVLEKLILTIVLISILIMFFATPKSYALLEIEDGDFYYAGSTEGSYQATGSNIFSWILKALGDIADFILGMLTLAPRMVFVGWTALIEKALTWAVESSAGVTSSGTIVENPTDLSAITSSNGNITVEAIVYNKVPALNADIFLQFDPSRTDFGLDRTISPTGHRLYCDKCGTYVDEYGIERYKGNYVEDCCNKSVVEQVLANPEEYKDTLFKEVTIEDVPGFCSCKCGGKETCYGCSMYFEQLTVEKPTIVIIKENVATWYYIIRMLAMAVMLVILIFVGIKMAISTIASEKAVYKRMFVDWVIGVIMLFTLHYFMIFVIYMNDVMVTLIEENANNVNQASLQQISEDLGKDLNQELKFKDLEIRVYEEIRTRAYDAKLSNGIIGMVMYMALVFMAVKYTVIYLKRLLTIMVLTLMAPGVGVAYALQKVISGKSQALKTWMTEYIMNVIIQTVHAIIYAVFISQAMIMSLTNIAGMIVALVFLNYASKAEETFKKIFKFGGKDSLVGHTDTAAQSMKETLSGAINTATGLAVGGKPAAKILMNTPYAKGLKALGKMGAERTFRKVSERYQRSKEEGYKRDQEEYDSKVEAEMATQSTDMDVETRRRAAIKQLANAGIIDPRIARLNRGDLPRDQVDAVRADVISFKNEYGAEANEAEEKYNAAKAEREALETKQKNGDKKVTAEDIQKAKEIEDAAAKDLETAKEQSERYQNLTQSNDVDATVQKVDRLLDIENRFQIRRHDGTIDPENASFSRRAFGTTTFDPVQMKFVSNKDSAKDMLFSESLFGISANDKKMFKEHVMPAVKGLIGMGSIFVGMGTIVTEPSAGMALLATGFAQTSAANKKIRGIKDCKDKYTFSRFGADTIVNIAEAATEQSRKEARKLTSRRLRTKRPNFVENFKSGSLKAATLGINTAAKGVNTGAQDLEAAALGFAAGMVISPAITMMRAKGGIKREYGKKGQRSTNRIVNEIKNGTTTADNENETTTRKLGFGRAIDAANEITVGTFKRNLSQNAHYSAILEYAKGNMEKAEKDMKKDAIELAEKQLKAENEHIINSAYEGFDFKEGDREVLVRRESVSNSDIKADFKPVVEEKGKPSEKVIDEKLSLILQTYSQKGKLDLSSKGIQREIIQKLESDLKAAKLISETQRIGDVFKQGEAGLIKVIKGKAGRINEVKSAEDTMRATLTSAEIKIVEESLGKAKRNASPTERMAAISGALNNQKDGTRAASTSDGTRAVFGGDGTRKADKSKTGDKVVLFGDEKKTQAVQAYVTAKYSAPKQVTMSSKKKMMAEFLGSALEQFSSDEIPPEVTDGTGKKLDSSAVLKDLYSKVSSASRSTKDSPIKVGGKEFILDQVQAEAASNVVRNLLEMMELNKKAEQLEIKTETIGYTQKKKKKSALSIEINRLKIEDLKDGESPQKRKKAIEALEREKAYVDQQSNVVGIAIDIPKVIEDIRRDLDTTYTSGKSKSDGSKAAKKVSDARPKGKDGSRSAKKGNDGSKSVKKKNGNGKAGGKK